MHVVAVAAPIGPMESAPITSLPFHTELARERICAFWTDDDQYVVRSEGADGVVWYRIDTGVAAEPDVLNEASLEAKRALGALMADIIPLGGGRVAFPVGSTGRRTYRVVARRQGRRWPY
ncbi:MAG: hypothetical protein HEQ38_19635 [Gemmatimonas sp.]|nr:hypothetical protein [Gemmatimonas sp.]